MGRMFRAIFSAITMFFTGVEGYASAFNNIGKWTDESSGTFVDQARIERAKQLKIMNKELTAIEE